MARNETKLEQDVSAALRVASGRELQSSACSAFMTLDGWRRLEDLKAGDRLAVPRRVSEPLHIQRMADDEVVLLAHMIGDESCVKNQPIRYASIDEDNLSAVTQAARHFGVSGQTRRPAARVITLRLPALLYLTHVI
jgi:replicative DNA helicase